MDETPARVISVLCVAWLVALFVPWDRIASITCHALRPRVVLPQVVTPHLDEEIDGVLFRRYAIGPNVWAPTRWFCPCHKVELLDATIEGKHRPIPHGYHGTGVLDTLRCAGRDAEPAHPITHPKSPTQWGNYWLSLADANMRLDEKARGALRR